MGKESSTVSEDHLSGKQEIQNRFFCQAYHGGSTAMGSWGELSFSQPPIFAFHKQVPIWLREHIFRRLDSMPGFKVALELEAISFEYWQKHDPQLIKEIDERIKLNQIEITDGTYTQPHGHILSHESMVRQFLYGQETLEEFTGSKSVTHLKQEHMFVPNMVGLLLSAGFRNVVLRAHIHHFGCCPAINEELIQWQGRDSHVITALPNYFEDRYPYGLNAEEIDKLEAQIKRRNIRNVFLTQCLDVSHDEDFIKDFLKHWEQNTKNSWGMILGHHEFLLTDWHRMGSSDEKLKMLCDRGYQPILPKDLFKTFQKVNQRRTFGPDYFKYAYLWGMLGDEILVAMKSSEAALYTAEVEQTLLSMLDFEGYDVNNILLEEGWKKILESQSHDMHICPSSFSFSTLDFPARLATRWCRDVHSNVERVIKKNTRDLCKYVTKPDKQPSIIIFNPLSFSRIGPVEVSIDLPKSFCRGLRLYNDRSEEIIFDCLHSTYFPDGSLCHADLILPCNVPGFGFQMLRIEPCSEMPRLTPKTVNKVNKSDITAVITNNGTIKSLTINGFNYLATDNFEGNELTADFLDGLVRTGNQQGYLSCMSGHYLSEFSIGTILGSKPVTKRLRFYNDLNRIDFQIAVDFGVDCSTAKKGDYMLADPLGSMRVHFNPSFEGSFFSDFALSVEQSSRICSPGQSFGCFTDGRHGITLINRGNIGYYNNKEKGDILSLILASGDSEYRYGPYTLSGKMSFDYSLIPHNGDWAKSKSVLHAMEVNTPVQSSVVFGQLREDFKIPLISISQSCILSTALLRRKGLTFLRLWNSNPEKVDTKVLFNCPIKNLWETDIFGSNSTAVKRIKNVYQITFSQFELKTFLIDM